MISQQNTGAICEPQTLKKACCDRQAEDGQDQGHAVAKGCEAEGVTLIQAASKKMAVPDRQTSDAKTHRRHQVQ